MVVAVAGKELEGVAVVGDDEDDDADGDDDEGAGEVGIEDDDPDVIHDADATQNHPTHSHIPKGQALGPWPLHYGNEHEGAVGEGEDAHPRPLARRLY